MLSSSYHDTVYYMHFVFFFDNLNVDMNMFRTIWIIVHLIWPTLGLQQPVNDGEFMADELRNEWFETDNVEMVML